MCLTLGDNEISEILGPFFFFFCKAALPKPVFLQIVLLLGALRTFFNQEVKSGVNSP